MKRYHPILVTLHWILAILIIVALIMGSQVLATTPNSAPEKMTSLQGHMSIGVIILVLMLVRLVIRFMTKKPPHADIGNDLLNKGGIIAHYALYAGVFTMCVSGLALANAAGLPDIVFFGSGEPLPEDFSAFAPRAVHGMVSTVLSLVIAAHIIAALYHQFVRKDSLLSRMGYGKK